MDIGFHDIYYYFLDQNSCGTCKCNNHSHYAYAYAL